eukprot:TRINITY_DN911_c3_g2_i1.p2 TRINITY_DN911_c3_g2~~TRINITY_DN911_c3_g2_i1.p2  ORF type:complete len:145 (+),score=29.31 TRINITY_DN911_c3_g2_i1:61-495(+)
MGGCSSKTEMPRSVVRKNVVLKGAKAEEGSIKRKESIESTASRSTAATVPQEAKEPLAEADIKEGSNIEWFPEETESSWSLTVSSLSPSEQDTVDTLFFNEELTKAESDFAISPLSMSLSHTSKADRFGLTVPPLKLPCTSIIY